MADDSHLACTESQSNQLDSRELPARQTKCEYNVLIYENLDLAEFATHRVGNRDATHLGKRTAWMDLVSTDTESNGPIDFYRLLKASVSAGMQCSAPWVLSWPT